MPTTADASSGGLPERTIWHWRSSAALLVSPEDHPSGSYTRDRSHRGNSLGGRYRGGRDCPSRTHKATPLRRRDHGSPRYRFCSWSTANGAIAMATKEASAGPSFGDSCATRSAVSPRPAGRLHGPDDAQVDPRDGDIGRRTIASVGHLTTGSPLPQESRRARRDGCIARTMRKPDRTKLPAVAALLLSSDLRLLVRHETNHDFGAAYPAWRCRIRDTRSHESSLRNARAVRRFRSRP